MLFYCSNGWRDYHKNPLPLHERSVWEFQAVIRGACAPVFPGVHEELSTNRLWVFAPDCVHGWTGRTNHSAEIVVMQFTSVPRAIRHLVPPGGAASVSLGRGEIFEIKEIYSSFLGLPGGSDPRSELLALKNLAALGLILAGSADSPAPNVSTSYESDIVQASLRHYSDKLTERPPISAISSSVGISVSHLRRLYQGVLQCPPRTEFLKRRMQRAKYLLATTNRSVKEIAFEVGYGSTSTFSRAFMKFNKKPPELWRTSQHQVTREWAT